MQMQHETWAGEEVDPGLTGSSASLCFMPRSLSLLVFPVYCAMAEGRKEHKAPGYGGRHTEGHKGCRRCAARSR